MNLLRVKNATFSYNESRAIFKDASFEVGEGRVLTILGPNGAGKSTLLGAVIGMNKLASGTIEVYGKPVESYSRGELAKYVGYIPQTLSTVFPYSVMDYLVMGRAPYISTFARPSQADYDLAYEKLQVMGAEQLASRSFSELSGGERQQVAVARVLVQDPRLIILDEPTSALDFGNQMRVIRLVERLSAQGYAVMLTTHVPDHAIILNDTVAALDRFGAMTVGSADEILTEGFLSELYQVEVKIEYLESIGRKTCVVK